MAENQKTKQEIPAMYGDFSVFGKVERLDKEKFISQTQTGREKRSLSIGLRTAKDNMIFINMTAIAQDNVYFSKRDEQTKQTETKIVPWAERETFSMPGFLPMSRVNVGVDQTVKEDGTLDNNNQIKIMFDALQDIYDHVNIGDDLYIKGSVSVESYFTQAGEKRSVVRLNPNQISKRKAGQEINFEAEDFVERNTLNQTIIPTDVEFDTDADRAVIYGLVIGNKKEGTIEFEVVGEDDMKFAKRLKELITETPYLAIGVQAKIVNEGNVGANQKVWDDFLQTYVVKRRQQGQGTKYQYVAAIQDSQDLTTYTEENVAAFRDTFCRGQEEFGANNAQQATGGKGSEDSLWGNI